MLKWKRFKDEECGGYFYVARMIKKQDQYIFKIGKIPCMRIETLSLDIFHIDEEGKIVNDFNIQDRNIEYLKIRANNFL